MYLTVDKINLELPEKPINLINVVWDVQSMGKRVEIDDMDDWAVMSVKNGLVQPA